MAHDYQLTIHLKFNLVTQLMVLDCQLGPCAPNTANRTKITLLVSPSVHVCPCLVAPFSPPVDSLPSKSIQVPCCLGCEVRVIIEARSMPLSPLSGGRISAGHIFLEKEADQFHSSTYLTPPRHIWSGFIYCLYCDRQSNLMILFSTP